MECHDDWPEHKSVKEQLNAGTIGKVAEKVEKRQPSVAAKLLESRNIGEWPEFDEMKQRIATNNTSAPSETQRVKMHEPLEWPANDALKEQMMGMKKAENKAA